MNRLTLLVAFLLVIALTCVVFLRGHAAPPEPEAAKAERVIIASGSATVVGKPDSARVYFGVVTPGKTVPAARAENARIVGEIQKALLALKLPDLKAKTSDSRVSIEYEKDSRSQIVGYQVEQSFTVLVKESDPEKLGIAAGHILDAGLQNGVNQEGRIEFFLADDTELRRQAMTKASEDALANAQAYAAGVKAKSVQVVKIVADDDNPWLAGIGAGQGAIFGRVGEPTPLVAGEWKVSSRVHVACYY